MPGVDRRSPLGETGRERITSAWLRGVDAQFVEPRSSGLLRITPTDAGDAERDSQERSYFPPQHRNHPSPKSVRIITKRGESVYAGRLSVVERFQLSAFGSLGS